MRCCAPIRSPRSRATRSTYWMAPIVADAEAGFGGPLNAFELMKAMIEAGAAGVHFEDQLASEKKCGHLGGKVLVPTPGPSSGRSTPPGSPPTSRHRHHRSCARTDAALGDADHLATSTSATPVHRRRPHGGGLLPPQAGHHAFGRARDRAQPRLRALLRPALVGDLDPDLGEAREFAEEIRASSPASCSPTIAHRRSTGAPSSTASRSRRSRSRSRTWATSSSS